MALGSQTDVAEKLMVVSKSMDLEVAPRSEDLRVIHEGLRAFTDSYAGPINARPFAIFIRDDDGKVVGGLDAELRWTWLFISYLWLPEYLRGQGLGSALLERAEAFAKEQDCVTAYLDTLEFQAVSFYERHGYRTYGILEGFPPGSRRFHLQKALR